jgi:hypothetical protein
MFKFQKPDDLRNFFDLTREKSSDRGVQWAIEGDQVIVSKRSKLDNHIDTDAVIQKLLEYVHNIETQI